MFELFLILGIIWSIFVVFYKLMDKKESIYREKNEKNAKLIQAKNNKRFVEQLIEKANKSLADQKDIRGNKKVRRWFSEMCSEVSGLLDEYKARELELKSRPSMKGAQQVRVIKKEKRFLPDPSIEYRGRRIFLSENRSPADQRRHRAPYSCILRFISVSW